MNAGQVRRTIVEPPRLARTEVEDGLVEVVLDCSKASRIAAMSERTASPRRGSRLNSESS